VRMPYLQIQASDTADLISYIDAHSKEPQPGIALETLYALTTQDGGHLGPADLAGRPFAVVFGYTHCPDVCPTTLLDWSNLLQGSEASVGPLKLLFVSVDHERDAPEVLKSVMASFDPSITALTGGAAQIAEAAKQFGAYYAKSNGENANFSYDHSTDTYFVTRKSHLFGTMDLATQSSARRSMLARLVAQ